MSNVVLLTIDVADNSNNLLNKNLVNKNEKVGSKNEELRGKSVFSRNSPLHKTKVARGDLEELTELDLVKYKPANPHVRYEKADMLKVFQFLQASGEINKGGPKVEKILLQDRPDGDLNDRRRKKKGFLSNDAILKGGAVRLSLDDLVKYPGAQLSSFDSPGAKFGRESAASAATQATQSTDWSAFPPSPVMMAGMPGVATYIEPSMGFAVDAYGQPAMVLPSAQPPSPPGLPVALPSQAPPFQLDSRMSVGSEASRASMKGMGKGQGKNYARASVIRSHGVTKMLKNIPNKYTRVMLIERLQRDFKGQIDFLYMPMDFATNCNVGYAFVNFRSLAAAHHFIELYDGVHTKTCLPGYNSNKVAKVTHATVQGMEHNIERLGRSPLLPQIMHKVEWQPALFDEAGDMSPFPMEQFAAIFQEAPPAFIPTTPDMFGLEADQNRISFVEHQLMGLQAPPVDVNALAMLQQQQQQMAMDFQMQQYTVVPVMEPLLPFAPVEVSLQSNTSLYGADGASYEGRVSFDGRASDARDTAISNEALELSPGISPMNSNISRSQSYNVPANVNDDVVSNASFSPTASPIRVPSHLVSLDRSTEGKRLSETTKGLVVQKQMESFFDLKRNTLSLEDKKLLRKNMDEEGFVPISTLMQMKAIMYPGHDIMRQCIAHSDMFEFKEEDDTFRVANTKLFRRWIDSF